MVVQYVRLDGVRQTTSALRRMDADFQRKAKDQTSKITEVEAARIKAAARSRQQRLAAQTVRVRRGTTPAIAAGGSTYVTNSDNERVRGGDIFFGSEFGGRRRPTTQQFQPWLGKQGYFFWPTIRDDAEMILEQWNEAIDVLARDWEASGG